MFIQPLISKQTAARLFLVRDTRSRYDAQKIKAAVVVEIAIDSIVGLYYLYCSCRVFNGNTCCFLFQLLSPDFSMILYLGVDLSRIVLSVFDSSPRPLLRFQAEPYAVYFQALYKRKYDKSWCLSTNKNGSNV